MTSGQIKAAVEAGYPMFASLADLRDVTYLDLPTGHWPMWSRPQELAALIGAAAQRASAGYAKRRRARLTVRCDTSSDWVRADASKGRRPLP